MQGFESCLYQTIMNYTEGENHIANANAHATNANDDLQAFRRRKIALITGISGQVALFFFFLFIFIYLLLFIFILFI